MDTLSHRRARGVVNLSERPGTVQFVAEPQRAAPLRGKTKPEWDVADAAVESRTSDETAHPKTSPESPTAYRALSAKGVAALTAAGGALTIAGGLGNWMRAASAAREGDPLEDIGAVMGYSEGTGWILAALGAIALLGGFAWFMSSLAPKMIPILAALAVAAITAQRLPQIQSGARNLVERATEELGFATFHAGFGWGAYLLLMGSILLLLGAFAGILREMDMRRGRV